MLQVVGTEEQVSRRTVCVRPPFAAEVLKQFHKTALQGRQIDRTCGHVIVDTEHERLQVWQRNPKPARMLSLLSPGLSETYQEMTQSRCKLGWGMYGPPPFCKRKMRK